MSDECVDGVKQLPTDEDTEVVGDGEYIVYAESRFGPFTVEYRSGSRGFKHVMNRSSQFRIAGPHIDTVCVALSEWDCELNGWDYIERGDEPVNTPSKMGDSE